MKTINCAIAVLFAALLTGCALSGTAGLGEEAGATRLPSGLTLLGSETFECGGTVQVVSGVRARDSELQIAAGQNATYRVDNGDIGWACLERGSPASDTVRCSAETTHVRITTAAVGRELLFECYG